jgi:hypothetical protein
MRLNAHRLPPRFIHRLPPRFIHRLPPRLIHRLASYLLSWAYTQAASPSDTQAASYHRLPPIRGSLIHRLPPIPSDTQAACYTWLGPCCGALLRGPADPAAYMAGALLRQVRHRGAHQHTAYTTTKAPSCILYIAGAAPRVRGAAALRGRLGGRQHGQRRRRVLLLGVVADQVRRLNGSGGSWRSER